ncbi:DUF1330 domain-containing protein [Cupriavidus sp. IDO]|uniref:DUF1330 domain-containing protein n=1 Tax=Cupriavidus sp. IDO TaxID=1539142 RepID=UPI000579492C|nr:DUF1330 domain-containing protein [Cupriavidus sp. IDO]KWR90449.1 hypothetical protein RM96_09500 [Cupriavidus sp. IDO]
MTKGYIFAEVDIHSPGAEWDEYASKVEPTLDSYGGVFLIRGGTPHVLEGNAKTGTFVVLEFESPEDATAWYTSTDYQRILPLRLRNADARVICLPGAG